MVHVRRKIGDHGEEIAAAFLRLKGYRIVDRNWHCRAGEIDLIVEKNGDWRFVEVKTRTNDVYGDPAEAVTPTKIRHLFLAVEAWLTASPNPPKRYQLDVVAITCKPGMKPEIRWIEGVGG